jgi:hypothetical protein
MPNLWTQTTQKVYEVFYGPRTKDTEFDIKIDEMKVHENSFKGIKAILLNFQRNTQGIKNYCKDVYTYLSSVYGENSAYSAITNELCAIHKEIERLYDVMVEVVTNLAAQTGDWDKYFEEAKTHLATREVFRKTYDHYDMKMEKLVKVRNERLAKGLEESPKDIEVFERVFI